MTLTISKLDFNYDNHNVLKDINLNLRSGETNFLLGPNGSGKSTLFKCILGHLIPQKGTVNIDNNNISKISNKEKAKLIAYIPQSCNPSYNHTVLEITLMGRNPYIGRFSHPQNKDIDIAYNALEKLNISHLAEKGINQISGGELQLVLISRALAQQSQIIIMDEPTSNLDYGNQIMLLEHMEQLSKDGKMIIISSHNPQHAISFGNKVAVLNENKIVCFGNPKEVLTSNLLSNIYKRKITTVNYTRSDGTKTIFIDNIGEN